LAIIALRENCSPQKITKVHKNERLGTHGGSRPKGHAQTGLWLDLSPRTRLVRAPAGRRAVCSSSFAFFAFLAVNIRCAAFCRGFIAGAGGHPCLPVHARPAAHTRIVRQVLLVVKTDGRSCPAKGACGTQDWACTVLRCLRALRALRGSNADNSFAFFAFLVVNIRCACKPRRCVALRQNSHDGAWPSTQPATPIRNPASSLQIHHSSSAWSWLASPANGVDPANGGIIIHHFSTFP